MEFKGTEGKWEIMMDGDEIKIIQADSLENGIGCRSYIAICEEVQCIEDSNLIAAAPELLDALIKLVDIVDDMVHGPSTDAAHAAINKALGG